MKKIISSDQIKMVDEYTILNEPIESLALMERASEAFVKAFVAKVPEDRTVHVVCGTGNNGGDGFAIARLLLKKGYYVVVSLIKFSEKLSVDCQKNFDKLPSGTINIIDGTQELCISEGIIVDAIFGSGLNRPVIGQAVAAIKKVNESKGTVISVDMPSGLFADRVDLSGEVVNADYTITFQRPKLTFLIPETGGYVGGFQIVNIGLDEEYIESIKSPFELLEIQDVTRMLPERTKFQHKGDFGRVQVFSGSLGKIGAAFLCSKAVLRVGAGLLTVHIPGCGYDIMQQSLPEAMVSLDVDQEALTSGVIQDDTNAVCIGSGVGTAPQTVEWFAGLLEEASLPLVLDADALNIIADQRHLLDFVPEHSILTPHVGEFHRLFGDTEDGLERIEKMRNVAVDRKLVLILKGAHTAVALPDGRVVFNSTGNVGMATAGSGDVLSGMITGLKAQGLNSESAALAGVFLHGLAGDLAEKKVGKMPLMASDLLNEIPKAINNAKQMPFI